jgi:NAD+ synthase
MTPGPQNRYSGEMSTLREHIRTELHVQAPLDPATELNDRVAFLADYLTTTGMNGYVLGISGGQDSTLAGRLCQLAVERVRAAGGAAEFVAMRLPYGIQAGQADADIALRFIGADRMVEVNIKGSTDAASAAAGDALGAERIDDFVRGNIKARERMVAQYAVAGQLRMLVVGTDHAAEAVTGFFTKYGDGGADVTPLSGLTKRQGAALLHALGAPESTWSKTPTADLEDDRPALADEVALGVTYREIDDYLEGDDVSPEAAATIERWFGRTHHKRHLPVAPAHTWWRPAPPATHRTNTQRNAQ